MVAGMFQIAAAVLARQTVPPVAPETTPGNGPRAMPLETGPGLMGALGNCPGELPLETLRPVLGRALSQQVDSIQTRCLDSRR